MDGTDFLCMISVEDNDEDLLDCPRMIDNLTKESWLINPIRSALTILKIGYKPTYLNHSFKKGQHEADFDLCEKGNIEAKNWL